jgi:hypothetical protein
MSDVCDNCERQAGNLETLYQWGDSAVCLACYNHLSALPTVAELEPPDEVIAVPSDYVDLRPGPQSFTNVVNIRVGHSIAGRTGGATALMLSIIPGLGHLYLGKIFIGLFWLIVCAAGYMLIFPGILLHFLCALDASRGARLHH